MILLTELALLLFSLLAELLIGNFTLALALPVYAALYLCAAHSWKHGIAAAAGAGLMLDILYCRPVYFSIAVYLAALALGHRISLGFGRTPPLAPVAAGAVAGAVSAAGNLAGAAFCTPFFSWAEFFAQLLFQAIFGGFFFLLLCLVLDRIGRLAGLPLFAADSASFQPNRTVRRVRRRRA